MTASYRSMVFVADDDVALLEAVAKKLERAGFNVQTFEDPMEVLDVAEEDPPDCLLVDVRMRPVSGLALIDQLRGRGVKSPVILMSGSGPEDSSIQEAVRRHHKYIQKGTSDFFDQVVREIHDAEDRYKTRCDLDAMKVDIGEVKEQVSEVLVIVRNGSGVQKKIADGVLEVLREEETIEQEVHTLIEKGIPGRAFLRGLLKDPIFSALTVVVVSLFIFLANQTRDTALLAAEHDGVIKETRTLAEETKGLAKAINDRLSSVPGLAPTTDGVSAAP